VNIGNATPSHLAVFQLAVIYSPHRFARDQ
jgi:hypothetical protein